VSDSKNRRRLSDDPSGRTGVYKRLNNVPVKYHLRNHEAAYSGMDAWNEFVEERTDTFESQATYDRCEKSGQYYKDHMSDVGRHNAFTPPEHVEEYLTRLHDDDIGQFSCTRQLQTIYLEYFQPLDTFYTWLLWHTDHPHVCHLARMAAIAGGFVSDVWQRKLDQNHNDGTVSRPWRPLMNG